LPPATVEPDSEIDGFPMALPSGAVVMREPSVPRSAPKIVAGPPASVHVARNFVPSKASGGARCASWPEPSANRFASVYCPVET
jgi:hypothetical protein